MTTTATGRQRILDEASALLTAGGYADASLRGIAAGAGMKAGSVYYHFESKDELIEEILRIGLDLITGAFDEADDPDAEPRERLAAHVRAHLDALFNQGAYTASHVTMFRTVPEPVRAAIVPLRDRYEKLWTDLLTELRDDGALRGDLDLRLARLVLIGAMNSTIEWFQPQRDSDIDQLAEAIVDHFWSGLAAREAA